MIIIFWEVCWLDPLWHITVIWFLVVISSSDRELNLIVFQRVSNNRLRRSALGDEVEVFKKIRGTRLATRDSATWERNSRAFYDLMVGGVAEWDRALWCGTQAKLQRGPRDRRKARRSLVDSQPEQIVISSVFLVFVSASFVSLLFVCLLVCLPHACVDDLLICWSVDLLVVVFVLMDLLFKYMYHLFACVLPF